MGGRSRRLGWSGTAGAALALSACATPYDDHAVSSARPPKPARTPIHYQPPIGARPSLPALPRDQAAPAEPDAYAWMDRADALLDAIADSPPDFSFTFEGERMFAWTIEDVLILEESREDGYALYLFQGGQSRPFYVRTPDYAAGFERGELAVIYTRAGEIFAGDGGWRRNGNAMTLRLRGEALHRAAQRRQWDLDSARAWARAQIWAEHARLIWEQAWLRDLEWQRYRRRIEVEASRRALHEERNRRGEAAERFRRWRDGGFTGSPPRGAQPRREGEGDERPDRRRDRDGSRQPDRRGDRVEGQPPERPRERVRVDPPGPPRETVGGDQPERPRDLRPGLPPTRSEPAERPRDHRGDARLPRGNDAAGGSPPPQAGDPDPHYDVQPPPGAPVERPERPRRAIEEPHRADPPAPPQSGVDIVPIAQIEPEAEPGRLRAEADLRRQERETADRAERERREREENAERQRQAAADEARRGAAEAERQQAAAEEARRREDEAAQRRQTETDADEEARRRAAQAAAEAAQAAERRLREEEEERRRRPELNPD